MPSKRYHKLIPMNFLGASPEVSRGNNSMFIRRSCLSDFAKASSDSPLYIPAASRGVLKRRRIKNADYQAACEGQIVGSQWLFKVAKGSDAGFTLIEMLVVLVIMAIILGLVLVDFAGNRPARDLRIAQNELVTSIRKAQSYSLFSRDSGGGKAVQYYILKFNKNTPDRYYIQNISDLSIAPTLNVSETILLPKNIVFDPSGPFLIDRPWPITDPSSPPSCALLAFKSPFGKVYVNEGCNPESPAYPYSLTAGDDYKKILEHINNLNNLTVSDNTDLVITLKYNSGNQNKKILIKGMTGLVCPTQDGINCSF